MKATRLPSTISSCDIETKRPRWSAGAISPIYIAETVIDAKATPPMKRPITSISKLTASAERIDDSE